jgi:hypothetical protein
MSHREEAPRQELCMKCGRLLPRMHNCFEDSEPSCNSSLQESQKLTNGEQTPLTDAAEVSFAKELYPYALMTGLARQLELSLSQCREAQRWIPVSERLPDDEPLRGIPYMEFSAGPFAVIHRDRPDYPITAHAIFSDNPSAMGVAIPTNGTSRFKYVCWYSAGRDPCNPFDMATGSRGPFKDSAGYARTMPNYLGFGITHWQPLPSAPKE